MSKIHRVLFIGSKLLGLKVLDLLWYLGSDVLLGAVTIDDTADTRSVYGDFQKFSESKGLQLFTARNREDSENIVMKLKPELCFVVDWYWLISSKCLASVPHGFLGVHASLLPKRRGGAPIVWAMIDGETETGVSLFFLVEGMDSGDIVAQRSIAIAPTDYVSDVLAKLDDVVLSIFRAKHLPILNGQAERIPQNHSFVEATYCAQRILSDGLIDWHKPAKRIYDFIRAQSDPYPGAFSFLNGQKLTIWRVRPLNMVYQGTPGQVVRISSEGVTVICGDRQPLLLELIQLESDPKKPANEVLRSIKLRLTDS
jgi:methionyl-tRNA formyltransferase